MPNAFSSFKCSTFSGETSSYTLGHTQENLLDMSKLCIIWKCVCVLTGLQHFIYCVIWWNITQSLLNIIIKNIFTKLLYTRSSFAHTHTFRYFNVIVKKKNTRWVCALSLYMFLPFLYVLNDLFIQQWDYSEQDTTSSSLCKEFVSV